MSELKGKGKPNRDIQAAIGDIYTDMITGKRYKCIFGYRSGEENFDTQWVELKNDKEVVPVKEELKKESSPEVIVESEKIPGGKIEESKAEEVEQTAEKIEESKADKQKQQSRKNYTNYSKPKNK